MRQTDGGSLPDASVRGSRHLRDRLRTSRIGRISRPGSGFRTTCSGTARLRSSGTSAVTSRDRPSASPAPWIRRSRRPTRPTRAPGTIIEPEFHSRTATPRITAANGECGPSSNLAFNSMTPRWPTRRTPWRDGVCGATTGRPCSAFSTSCATGLSMDAGYYRRWYGNFRATDNTLVTSSDFNTYCITAPGGRTSAWRGRLSRLWSRRHQFPRNSDSRTTSSPPRRPLATQSQVVRWRRSVVQRPDQARRGAVGWDEHRAHEDQQLLCRGFPAAVGVLRRKSTVPDTNSVPGHICAAVGGLRVSATYQNNPGPNITAELRRPSGAHHSFARPAAVGRHQKRDRAAGGGGRAVRRSHAPGGFPRRQRHPHPADSSSSRRWISTTCSTRTTCSRSTTPLARHGSARPPSCRAES